MSDAYDDWIGRSLARDDIVTPRLAREFAATLSPFLFAGAEGDPPPGLHWALAPAVLAAGELGPDGAEAKGLFLPAIPLPRRMWAGGSIETVAPFRLGMAVRRTSTLADLKMRESAGGSLCFVSIVHEFCAGAELLLRERQDLVFRDGGPRAGRPEAAPQDSDMSWQVTLSPLLLFRFSAVTFNGHRIHYDHPYTVETEGYPGLVTHGPLQAALMFNQAATLLGVVPRRFDYRCTAPLIAGAAAAVHSRRSGDGVAGQIVDAAGVVTARYEAPGRETAAA